MGVPNDQVVVIKRGKKDDDECMITVNCPDQTGLGCDLCRIILEFGLCITKADLSTDGKWCYVVFWVVLGPGLRTLRWKNLEERLLAVCPSWSVSYYLNEPQPRSAAPQLYLLKFYCRDRKGLLHDVTQVLCELELIIQRVKVMTTPDDKVLDLFFITDCMELLHTKQRQNETCERLESVLGESCISCELQSMGPEFGSIKHGTYAFSASIEEELFSCELSGKEIHSQALSPDLTKIMKASITVDNTLSQAHTLLQIHCVDQKGLLYDIMRMSKDSDIQISYGRFPSSAKGYRDVDLFVQQKDGKKITDTEKLSTLSSQLKLEMLHSLRVVITNRGPDTELLVANPVETCGKGRPRVFYDITLALKVLRICIFSAEIRRHSTSDREWEVYRFRLDESHEFPLASVKARTQIVDMVRRTLMGC